MHGGFAVNMYRTKSMMGEKGAIKSNFLTKKNQLLNNFTSHLELRYHTALLTHLKLMLVVVAAAAVVVVVVAAGFCDCSCSCGCCCCNGCCIVYCCCCCCCFFNAPVSANELFLNAVVCASFIFDIKLTVFAFETSTIVTAR